MMRWINRSIYVYALLALVMSPAGNCGPVNTWEGTITLPTYPWQPDDINPRYFALEDHENSIIYPYTMQDNLSSVKEDREYKAIFLENEYLKVICLPELGGRIFSVRDKTTNEEMFHRNDVVKPGLIAMRGAWITGGIEWNTGPHGHTVTAVSPVNVTVVESPDGSASLVITDTEMIFRTRWQVVVTLHPGKAFLDEKVSMFNPTDGVHPYYFWNCTAFVCTPKTRYIYPMTLGCDHAGTSFFSWPIDKGVDITWLRNYKTPTSVFAYECDFDFFGAYDAGLDRGIVQYANHNILTGKKAWTWGQSEDGLIRQRNLHEGNEQYIEVQSGPLRTQADYGLLHPREEVAWQEWWYPIHGFGDGFEYATRDAAVQRNVKNGQVEFRILATGRFPDARCRFMQNGIVLDEKMVDLSPNSPIVFSLKCDTEKPVDVQIVDYEGVTLANYLSPLQIRNVKPPEPDWLSTKQTGGLTAEETYYKGLLFDKQTNRPEARKWYEKALSLDPQHMASLKALAVLDLEAGLSDDAIQRLQSVMARNADDGMAAYYLGASYFQKGDFQSALIWGYKAVRTLDHISLGYDLVGRSLMCLGKFTEALEAFEKSVYNNPEDPRAKAHLLITYYKVGDTKKTQELIQDMNDCDPTDIVPYAVDTFLNPWKTKHFVQTIQNLAGETDFEIEEACLVFSECGLIEEAYTVFAAFYASDCSIDTKSPMPFYYLACWADRIGKTEKVAQFLNTAQKASTDYVFPSRLETIDVLQFAIQSPASSESGVAKAYLYLGNLYGGLGRMQEAKDHWESAVKRDKSLSVGWRNLGLLAWKQNKNLFQAEINYRAAVKARPDDQTSVRDLAQILIEDNRRSEAINLLEKIGKMKNLRGDIVEILAQAYVDEKDYDNALSLLNQSFFSNWENRTFSRTVFVTAHMERGKKRMNEGKYEGALDDFAASLTYPEYLGVGRPADAEEAEMLYWKGKALAALGRRSESKEVWRQAAQSREGSGTQNKYRRMSEDELKK